MYVLMDLEWYEQKKKPLMLTQIAALTVDENWTPEDLFYPWRFCPGTSSCARISRTGYRP